MNENIYILYIFMDEYIYISYIYLQMNKRNECLKLLLLDNEKAAIFL